MRILHRMIGLAGALALTSSGMAALASTADAATPAPPSPAAIKAAAAGNYHQIVNRAYNQCIDVNQASTDDGVQLQIVGCNGTDAQAWAPVLLSGQTYYFINKHSGDCIDVRNGSNLPGAAVQQYPCNGTPAQQWIRTPRFVNGAIWETFQNPNGGNLLDTVSGAGSKLMQWTANGGAPQDWQVR